MEANNENYEFRVYPDEKSPKLFKSPLLEVLTKTKLWIISVLYSAVAGVWLWIYMHYFQKEWIMIFFISFLQNYIKLRLLQVSITMMI